MTTGKDAHISTFRELLCLTNFKWLTCCKDGPYRSSEAEINRPVMFSNSFCSSFGLCIIAWIYNAHALQHLHHTDIFHYLVSSAVFSMCYPCMGSTYFYILTAIGDALADLIIYAPCREVGKGSSEWDLTTNSKTC